MKRTATGRSILSIYFLILCLHFFIFLIKKAEIYPSLIFPAFSAAPKLQDLVKFSITDLYGVDQNKHLVRLSKESFFQDFYDKHVDNILNTITVNEARSRTNPNIRNGRGAFIDFSKKQLNRLFPHTRFVALLIQKEKVQYHLSSQVLDRTGIVESRTLIKLY
ncbi:hypothetical protein [Larkinella soli]|uniref:hypothetical protein n=1 Tax=Larkinella soli TaxID=1770527 RepID=UPI000FFC3EDB|nr:hypothetical protein [Larkinella soli]